MLLKSLRKTYHENLQCRGAVVALIAGNIYCTPDSPSQCNTFWTVASALVVCLGAILWVVPIGGEVKKAEKKTE